MKAQHLTNRVKIAGLVLMIVLALSTAANAQEVTKTKLQLTKLDMVNLLAGLDSKCDGVKRDCIYYSAVYDLKEAVPVLLEQLENESDPSMQVLISLALCKIEKSMSTNLANGDIFHDWDQKVKTINEAIVKDYFESKSTYASSSSK